MTLALRRFLLCCLLSLMAIPTVYAAAYAAGHAEGPAHGHRHTAAPAEQRMSAMTMADTTCPQPMRCGQHMRKMGCMGCCVMCAIALTSGVRITPAPAGIAVRPLLLIDTQTALQSRDGDRLERPPRPFA